VSTDTKKEEIGMTFTSETLEETPHDARAIVNNSGLDQTSQIDIAMGSVVVLIGVTGEAFELVHAITDKRLKYGRLVVADATNVEISARRKFIEIARRHRVACVAVVFDLPAEVIAQRRTIRGDRLVPEHAVARQQSLLSASLPGLHDEGFTHIHVFHQLREIDGSTVRVIASR
jgi:predicted kinase